MKEKEAKSVDILQHKFADKKEAINAEWCRQKLRVKPGDAEGQDFLGI